jgi:hypothetical protein
MPGKFMRYPALFIILMFISFAAFAQTAEIRGFIYDKENSEPAIYTSVYLQNTTYGAQTNVDGFFTISRVPPGTYTLIVTSIGFDTLRQQLTVKAGDLISKKLFISKSTIQISEVQVSAESESKKTDVRVSVNKITPKEIKQIPTVGGDPDLAQYLQVLPGVVFSGDQGGQLYIRGGTPIQNKLLLDGMIIYNPFHSIGLYSVFDADIIRGADIYTGGFNAEYGDRISSIMDITTRDGNKKRFTGKASANTFTSKLLLEGPIRKETETAESSSSFLVTGKTSYLDKTSKSLYSYADTAGLPYSFNDIYAKVSFNSSTGSKFNVFGFHFTDNVDYHHVADLDWKSTGFGTNFVLVPTGSAVLIDGNFAYTGYRINLAEQDNRDRFSEIQGYNFGLNFSYFMGKDEFRYGLEVLGFRTDFSYSNAIGTSIGQEENTTELGGYLKYKKIGKKLVFEPGVRFSYYSSLAELSFEPRLGVKFNITDRFRLKTAGGFYSQNLLAATSDRDVVNLFYGFLSGSTSLPSTFRGEEVNSKLQKATHLIAGFEADLPYHFSLNVEAYIKDFTQLENINRDKIYEDDSGHNDKPDFQKKDFIIEQGIAKGADATLKYEHKRLYLWFVYSLGFVTRDDGVREYEPSFDRRHNVNLVASYKFGKKTDWTASARWNYGSAFPFTQSQSYYELMPLNGGIGSEVNGGNGQLGTEFADLNKGRLSDFHRLDVSLQKTFNFGKHNVLEITAGATNVYDRKNIFYINRYNSDDRIYQLPIIPNLGISYTF